MAGVWAWLRARRPRVGWAVGLLAAILAVSVGYWQRQAALPKLGRLVTGPRLRHSFTIPMGDFRITWHARRQQLAVQNILVPGHPVLTTVPHVAFVGGAVGSMTAAEHLGYFKLHRRIRQAYLGQTLSAIERMGHRVVLSGGLGAGAEHPSVPYTVTLRAVTPHRLAYQIGVGGGSVNRVYFTWHTQPHQGEYGFGVQFTRMNMNGRRLPILVSEHGYGRGVEPLTLLADLFDGGSGGTWYDTYAPVPFFFTSRLQALYSQNRAYQVFNFTHRGIGQLMVDRPVARGMLWTGTSPAALVQRYTAMVGRMAPLPPWTQHGLILGVEGGTQTVLARLKRLLAARVPVAGVWIQDWTGEQKTSFGVQVVWNWHRDRHLYPHWQQLLGFLRAHHIRLLGYVSPFLEDTGKPAGPANLYAVAKARGYLVQTAQGQPYPFHYPGRVAYLVDLTNPHAVTWLEGILRQQLVGQGFEGWMADFGEELPFDTGVRIYRGTSHSATHNLFPVLWAQLNRRVLQETGLVGRALVFMRSGYATSPRYATAFWLGDQLESWGIHNGLQSSVNGLLTAGLSGYTLEHSDTGGYTSLVRFPFHYVRTPALLMRWLEVNAFTVLLRSHEGNLPALNSQVWSSPALLRELRAMTLLYQALAPYREHLMLTASTRGTPVDRPVFFNDPHDAEAYHLGSREFMLGTEVLVAPAYHPGVHQLRVYLPPGAWREIWTRQRYRTATGRWVTVSDPIGHPAVFAQAGSSASHLLAAVIRAHPHTFAGDSNGPES